MDQLSDHFEEESVVKSRRRKREPGTRSSRRAG
jgi:hypothetical protein